MSQEQQQSCRGVDSGSSTSSPRCDSWTSGNTLSTAPTTYRSTDDYLCDDDDDDDDCDYHHDRYRPATAHYHGCDVAESRDSIDSRDRPDYPNDVRPSTAHARLQRPWTPPIPETLPATSREFAELFPSSRELRIRHDDATIDGNMNLKLDTLARTTSGHSRNVILFHLRMYDLKSRDFSLRRYCRDSGREICHTARKSHRAPIDNRPNVQRSLSTALAAIKSKADILHHHHGNASKEKQASPSVLQRHDSGYDSMNDDDDDDDDDDDNQRPRSVHDGNKPASDNSKPINLEFSNYSHVDIRRRGFKAHKRYDFDYWGTAYSWHVVAQKIGQLTEVSYNLLRRDTGNVVARIIPLPLSEAEAKLETEKGGWIPPCSMRLTDDKLLAERMDDLADVVVTSGLVALVDDSIRRHFRKSGTRKLSFPLPKLSGRRAAKAAGDSAMPGGKAPPVWI